MHGINNNKNRPYNKMKVNKRKYKKIKKKSNKKKGGGGPPTAPPPPPPPPPPTAPPTAPPPPPPPTTPENASEVGESSVPPQSPNIFVKAAEIAKFYGSKFLAAGLFKNKGVTEYVNGVKKDPANLFCGLFPNDSNLRKLFERYLNMKRLCPGLIGGNLKVSKNKTRKKRKKLSYKFRKITNKNNYIGGDNQPGRRQLIRGKIALQHMNQKQKKKSLEQSISMMKGRYYKFYNKLEIPYLYILYFTLINIKNAAIYQILLDLNLQNEIGEVYKSSDDGNQKMALKSLSADMRIKITKKYEEVDLFLGYQWFNYNYHAITDKQTTPSLAQPELFENLFSDKPESLPELLKQLKGIYGLGEITKDSLETFLYLNVNQMNISREERDTTRKNIQTIGDLVNEEPNDKIPFVDLLDAMGRNIRIQNNIEIKQIIKRKFFESNIYNSQILFGKNNPNNPNEKDCQSYFWEQIPKTLKEISEYMRAFPITNNGDLKLTNTENLRKLKLEFKKGLYPHKHEFDIQTTSAEEMNEFMERINSPNYNKFKATFLKDEQLISTYKFIEYSQLIYIIEVVLFKKIYYEKFLAHDIEIQQFIQFFFEKDIKYLSQIDIEDIPENIDDEAALNLLPKYRKYVEKIEQKLKNRPKIQEKFLLLYDIMGGDSSIKDLLLTRPDKGEPQSK